MNKVLQDLNRFIQLVQAPIAIIDRDAIVKNYNENFSHYFQLADNFTEDFELSEIIQNCRDIKRILKGANLSSLKNKEFTHRINANTAADHLITYTVKPVEEENSEYFLFELVDRNQKQNEINTQKLFFFDKLMNELPLNIYFKDEQSRFLRISKPMSKFFGLNTPEEAIGKNDFDFFHKDHAQEAFDDEQEILRTGAAKKLEEKEILGKGKESYAATTKYALRDARKNIIGTFGISQDITKLKIFEHQLKEAHADLNGKNEYLQQTLLELKQTQSQLIQSEKLGALGQLVAGIAHEINTPLGAINASACNMKESLQKLKYNIEFTLSEFSPTDIKHYNLLLSLIEPTNIYLSSKEKREKKKRLITQLKEHHQDKANSIAELLVYFNLDSLPEEINANTNLLSICSAVKNYVSLLRNIGNIVLAIDKTSKVVYALKTYIHKTPEGKKEPVDLAENIETVLTLNTNKLKRGINVIKNYDSVPLINAHADELGHIWNNLISNAIHAMGEKGTLIIDIRQKNTQTITITIIDDGCGIPEMHKDRIFEAFYTTKKAGEGTGMGLDIAKKIIDKHEGTIMFETDVEKGTTFVVTLPVK